MQAKRCPQQIGWIKSQAVAELQASRPQSLALGMLRALHRATGSLMLGSGEGAASWAERLKTSKLARFDSKLALSKAKLDRLDLLLLASDTRLSLLLRFKDAAVGEEMPVAREWPSLPSVTAIHTGCASIEVLPASNTDEQSL